MEPDFSDEDIADDEGELDRPVRRYALIIGAIGIIFTVCVFLHFLLVEQPRMDAAGAEVDPGVEQVDDGVEE